MPATVSINLCCYNSEKYLRETLDSIVNQTYKDWELIVINDGSKDSTENIVQEYINKGYPFKYYYQHNKGLSYSRNKALEYSSGKYIAFIDHDDIWLPEKLKNQVEALKTRPDVDFIYSNYFKKITYNNDKLILGLKGNQPQGFIFRDFIFKYEVFISTVIVSRNSLNSLDSLFDSRLRQLEEFDVFQRILYKHKAMYLNEVTAIYRFHENMETMRSQETLLKEHPIILNKFKNLDPFFAERHPDIIKYMEIRWIIYINAKYDIINGKFQEARNLISRHKWFSHKLLLLYMATFLPQKLVLNIYYKKFFLRGKL